MQGNGIVSFELNGVSHTLFFGMKAIRIIEEKSVNELLKVNDGVIPEKPEDLKNVDDIVGFCIMVYAGMCNEAESNGESYPTYKEAYLLTNEIIQVPGLDVKIFDTFKNSKSSESLVKLMNGSKKKTVLDNKKKQTGTK